MREHQNKLDEAMSKCKKELARVARNEHGRTPTPGRWT